MELRPAINPQDKELKSQKEKPRQALKRKLRGWGRQRSLLADSYWLSINWITQPKIRNYAYSGNVPEFPLPQHYKGSLDPLYPCFHPISLYTYTYNKSNKLLMNQAWSPDV